MENWQGVDCKVKRVSILLMILCLLFVFCGCGKTDGQSTTMENINTGENADMETSDNSVDSNGTENTNNDVTENDNIENNDTDTERKILIAYFSRADENYGVGIIEKGNTEIIAEMISEETGGELFHIERATPYPADYDECTDEAKQEQNDNARPALLEDRDISEYDVIFLGFPIWWGEMPMPVYTFLEGHDFSDKIIIPFCTHAGSGLAGTETSIENICDNSLILDGLSIKGEDAQNSQDSARETINKWLENLSY